MMEGLKICPFCGGEAKVMDMGYPHWVYCTKCGAKVQGRTHNEKDSIEAWNRRTFQAQDVPDTNIGDLISRQAAIEALHDEIVRRRISEDTNDDGTLDEFDTEVILRQLPPVTSKRKTGKWIYPHETTRLVSICSECGAHGRGNFCSNCGADMEG